MGPRNGTSRSQISVMLNTFSYSIGGYPIFKVLFLGGHIQWNSPFTLKQDKVETSEKK